MQIVTSEHRLRFSNQTNQNKQMQVGQNNLNSRRLAAAKNSYGAILLLLLFVLPLVACSDTSDQSPADQLKGSWKVNDYKHLDLHANSDDTAAEFMGQLLQISEQSVEFLDITLKNPVFDRRRAHAVQHMQYMYNSQAELLDIEKDSIDVINISGDRDFLYDFLLLDADHLAYPIDGTFYILQRQ